MNERKKNLMAMAGIGLAVLLVVSCGKSGAELIGNDVISIEEAPSEYVHVSRAYIYQEGEDLVITGRVKSLDRYSHADGHIDVALVGPDGSVMTRASARLVRKDPRNHMRNEYVFTARAHADGSGVSKVAISYHRPGYSGGLICGGNTDSGGL